MEPTLNYVSCPDASGGHRMAYWCWGDPAAPHLVVCVHGLARQGRDFDVLARSLVARSREPLRVVCPDIVGRGRSDWLKDANAYQVPTYAADVLALLAQLHGESPVATLDWVGTSMGGLIGMALAGTPDLPTPAPVRRLVLNDVGPVVQWRFVERLKGYLGRTGRFDSVQQAADALWAISSTFGPHTREQWLALCAPMVRQLPDGAYTLHYDPAIAVPVQSLQPDDVEKAQAAAWQVYDRIRAQVLLLRGEQSDVVAPETAHAMTVRGPRARLVEWAGIGHAPTLVADNQVEAVASFLLDGVHEEPASGTG